MWRFLAVLLTSSVLLAPVCFAAEDKDSPAEAEEDIGDEGSISKCYAAASDMSVCTAIIDDPKSPKERRVFALRSRGLAHHFKRNYDLAIADLSAAIKLDSSDEALFRFLGDAYYGKQDYDRAIAEYSAAIRLDATNPYSFSGRAAAHQKKSAFDEALSDLNAAMKLDPKSKNFHFARGNAHFGKGDYARAVEDFNVAVEGNPKNPYVLNRRADAYQKAGNVDMARADYQKVLDMPASPYAAEAQKHARQQIGAP